jgi:hypothetical protein
MQVRRTRAAALAAATSSAAVPALADAADGPIVANASFAQTVPFIDGMIYAYECHAAAPDAVSTTISSCVLESGIDTYPAPPVTSSGSAAFADQGVSVDPKPYQVCWTASSLYADGTTQGASGCTSTSPVAGVG